MINAKSCYENGVNPVSRNRRRFSIQVERKVVVSVKSRYSCQRGQAIVELAVVLPVFLLMVFGMLEFGNVMNEYLVITAAAREGARAAAVQSSSAEVISAVRAAASSVDRGNLTVAINPSATPRTKGQPVTVTVTNSVAITTPLISGFFPSNPLIIQSSAIMRAE